MSVGGRDRARDDGGRRLVERVLARPGGHALQQEPRLGEHELHVDPGRDLDAGVVLPGRDRVGPRVDLEGPLALDVGRHVGDVAVGLLAARVASAPGRGSGRSDRWRPPRRASWSWPSRNTEARTGIGSPDGGLGRLATEVDHGRDIHHGYPSNHAPHTCEPEPARKPTAAEATPWDVPAAVDRARLARRRRDLGRAGPDTAEEGSLLDRSKKWPSVLVRASVQTIHRPSCPARAPGGAGRPGRQPALVVAPAHPGRVLLDRPRAVAPRSSRRPGALPRCRGPRAARRAGRGRRLPRRASAPRTPTCSATSPRTAGTPARPATTPRAPSRTSRPSSASPSVLPQYSGGLGILAGDHLKASSDLGIPLVGRRPVLPPRLLQAGARPRRLAAGELPRPRPRRAAADRAPRGRRQPGDGLHRPARRPRPGGPDPRRPRRPRAAAAARHRHRGEQRPLPRRHRPALRRQLRAPAAPGAAPRRGRRTRPAGVVAHHRRPGARGLPRQRGPRRLPRHRAHPRAHRRRGRAAPRLRHRARGLPRRHGLHHAHAGPRGHRPVPARAASRSTSAATRRRRASRSTGSSRSAPRTTTAATPASSTWR